MLSLFGIIAVVVFAIQVFKAAKGTERNAPFWTIITVVVGIGLQWVFPVLVVVIVSVWYLMTGSTVETIESDLLGISLIISVVGLVLSIVGMALVSKQASKVKDEDPGTAAPPPPPTF